jgi:hypothetical protein
MWFWFRKLLYGVCASECNTYVRVFEEVGQFSYPWAVIGEDCPFFGFTCVFVCSFVLCWCVFVILVVL